jgi:hypothetical protein
MSCGDAVGARTLGMVPRCIEGSRKVFWICLLLLLIKGSSTQSLEDVWPVDGSFASAPLTISYVVSCGTGQQRETTMVGEKLRQDLVVRVELNEQLVAEVPAEYCRPDVQHLTLHAKLASAPVSHRLRLSLRRKDSSAIVDQYQAIFWSEDRDETLHSVRELIQRRNIAESMELSQRHKAAAHSTWGKMSVISVCECQDDSLPSFYINARQRVAEANRFLAERLGIAFHHSCSSEDLWQSRGDDKWLFSTVQKQAMAVQSGWLDVLLMIDCETVLLKRALEKHSGRNPQAWGVGYLSRSGESAWLLVERRVASPDVYSALVSAAKSFARKGEPALGGTRPLNSPLQFLRQGLVRAMEENCQGARSSPVCKATGGESGVRAGSRHGSMHCASRSGIASHEGTSSLGNAETDENTCRDEDCNGVHAAGRKRERQELRTAWAPGIDATAILARLCCPEAAIHGCSACGRGQRAVHDAGTGMQGEEISTASAYDSSAMPNLAPGALNHREDQERRTQFVHAFHVEGGDEEAGRAGAAFSAHTHMYSRRASEGITSENGQHLPGEKEEAASLGAGWHLAVVVPFRGREKSLRQLVARMSVVFAGVCNYTIWVVEQAEDKQLDDAHANRAGTASADAAESPTQDAPNAERGTPPKGWHTLDEKTDQMRAFNRGALLNAGYMLAEASGASHIALHDVDFVPQATAAHLYVEPLTSGPRHVIGRVDSAGGIVVVEPWMFRLANGHSNCMWGWGFDDHDLMERFRSVGLAMDRAHWNQDSFTWFEAFDMLKDCEGSHGNRTGCDEAHSQGNRATDRRHQAREGDAQTDGNQQRTDAWSSTGESSQGVHGRAADAGSQSSANRISKVATQEANRVRFLAARAPREWQSHEAQDLWESWAVGRRFPRHLACGVATSDWELLREPVSCGYACVRVHVSLGDHEWCEAV